MLIEIVYQDFLELAYMPLVIAMLLILYSLPYLSYFINNR